jgi:hypothetical protein
MGRTTNSNILRLGTTQKWVLPSSLPIFTVLSNYLTYFFQQHLSQLGSNATVGFGSVSGKYYHTFFSLTIDLYDLSERKSTFSEFSQFSLLPLILLYRHFSRDLLNKFPYPIKLFFVFKPLQDLDTSFILNYFKLRVHQGVSVVDVIAAVHKLLSGVSSLLGYRIEITGRYARQQRAAKLSISKGQVSLSQLSSFLHFKQDFVLLKHGKCGVKIWVNKSEGFIPTSAIYQS